MASIRKPAVSGWFYPDDPHELRRQVSGFLQEAAPLATGAAAPAALIAPHAGYVYSGPIAASAYANILNMRDRIHRVVLLGPAHRVRCNGLALSSAMYFETPLGRVSVDQNALTLLADSPQVAVLDAAHAQEHSIEVHLPFLQVILDKFTLVPVVAGNADAATIAAMLAQLWRDDTLLVVSSDLSHYLNYENARQRDSATATAIEQLRYQDIGHDDACGCTPLRGLLHLARARGWRARLVDLRNSGDTAGTRDRVVGYGAFTLTS